MLTWLAREVVLIHIKTTALLLQTPKGKKSTFRNMVYITETDFTARSNNKKQTVNIRMVEEISV